MSKITGRDIKSDDYYSALNADLFDEHQNVIVYTTHPVDLGYLDSKTVVNDLRAGFYYTFKICCSGKTVV